MPAAHGGGDVYDTDFIVLEGAFSKLSAGFLGYHRWQTRWVVLTPTSLHVYKAASQPSPGAKPTRELYLGGARVEVVSPGEVDAYRPHSFSVAVQDADSETVLAAPDAAVAAEWVTALGRQVFLTDYAAEHHLSLDKDGTIYDADMTPVTTAADVLASRDSPRASTIDASDAYSTDRDDKHGETDDADPTPFSA